MKDYMSAGKSVEQERVINRSRFIGLTYRISSEGEIPLSLEDSRKRYPGATHYCYGSVVGADGLIRRFSDDGEPGGTAGMPILQVLLQKELKNTLIVVVRYFGGIKLGAGGLIRAYSGTASDAIRKAGMVKMTYSSRGILTIDYSLLGSVEYFLRREGISIQEVQYGEKVQMQILTRQNWDGLVSRLTDLCSGNLKIRQQDGIYVSWDQMEK